MATEPTEPQEVSGRQVSPRQVALVVGGAVLLLALFWFLFLRGGGDPADDVVAPPPPVETTSPDLPPDGPDTDPDDKPPVETFEVFASRDPFEPLLSAEGEGGGTTDDGTTDDGATDEGATDTDGDGDVDEDDQPTDGGDVDGDGDVDGTDEPDETVEGHRVELVGITGRGDDASAQIQVDDTIYTVAPGETFAENFKLLSTSGECATVLYGDDQFTICEGEEILK